MSQTHRHRCPAAVFGQWQFSLAPADIFRIHDFICLAFLNNTVLMNAARVCEGILSDNRLATLHWQSAHPCNQLRGLHNLLSRHAAGVASEHVATRLERHYNLLKCGIARSFADAVHRALNLSRAGLDCSE